jgi:heme A synthase
LKCTPTRTRAYVNPKPPTTTIGAVDTIAAPSIIGGAPASSMGFNSVSTEEEEDTFSSIALTLIIVVVVVLLDGCRLARRRRPPSFDDTPIIITIIILVVLIAVVSLTAQLLGVKSCSVAE